MKAELKEDYFFPNTKKRLLVVDGEEKMCPYQAPFMIPRAGGRIQTSGVNDVTPAYRACGSWCSLFQLRRFKESDKGTTVDIACGGVVTHYEIDSEEVKPVTIQSLKVAE